MPNEIASDAVEAEAALGGVAALDADVAARRARRRRGERAERDVGHSYCSRYLRTM